MKVSSRFGKLGATLTRLVLLLGVTTALSSCVGHGSPEQDASLAGRDEGQVQAGAARIRLFWRTETEANAYGFFVYRADEPDGEMVCINREQPLPAAGTTTTPQEYVFYDFEVAAGGTYHYKLQQVDLNGSAKWLVGDPTPVAGTAKPLTDAEAAEVGTLGPMYRREAP